MAPSTATSAAWRSIYPHHGGFFYHPDHSERVPLSVFHQLHCLDGIRLAYWELSEQQDPPSHAKPRTMAHESNEGPENSRAQAKEEIAEKTADPAHVRHCIDYLRQSLMCHGDTTIEVKRAGVSGVRGSGTEHQCQDWERLRKWVESMQGQ
ncbi:MAG: hypothetical protein Q9208_006775 [Pyrenodesmia sp. 3 TL-2023]